MNCILIPVGLMTILSCPPAPPPNYLVTPQQPIVMPQPQLPTTTTIIDLGSRQWSD